MAVRNLIAPIEVKPYDYALRVSSSRLRLNRKEKSISNQCLMLEENVRHPHSVEYKVFELIERTLNSLPKDSRSTCDIPEKTTQKRSLSAFSSQYDDARICGFGERS